MQFRRITRSAGFQLAMVTVLVAALLAAAYFMRPGVKNDPATPTAHPQPTGTALPAGTASPGTPTPTPTQPPLSPSTQPPDATPNPTHPVRATPAPTVVAERVTVTVLCQSALASQALPEDRRAALPADGILLQTDPVSYFAGQSALDALRAAANAAGLPVEVIASLLGAAYLEGIGGLYEFDCGPLSGWLYRVNDVFPGVDCGKYVLQPGDAVVFVYTCDMGRDVGGG